MVVGVAGWKSRGFGGGRVEVSLLWGWSSGSIVGLGVSGWRYRCWRIRRSHGSVPLPFGAVGKTINVFAKINILLV